MRGCVQSRRREWLFMSESLGQGYCLMYDYILVLWFSFPQRILCIREDNLSGCARVDKYLPLGLTSEDSFVTGDLTQGLVCNLQIIFLAVFVDTKGILPLTPFDSDHQYLLYFPCYFLQSDQQPLQPTTSALQRHRTFSFTHSDSVFPCRKIRVTS